MEGILYALIIVLRDVCLDLNQARHFTDGMLGKYQSNPCFDNWKTIKKVLRYF